MPATPVHHTGTTDKAWDGPATEAAMPNDEATLRYTHAWAAPDAGDKKSDYKFPHHSTKGGPANMGACRNGMSRMMSANVPDADREGIRRHLQAHMRDGGSDVGDMTKAAEMAGQAARERRDAFRSDADGTRAVGERARAVPFEAQLRARQVERDGKVFSKVSGYASMTGRSYEMWDVFGPYQEEIGRSAFADTLAADPDVAFLVNHRGITMARTVGGTLLLEEDERGLRAEAWLNPERQDVRDLVSAIDDKLITEMSFAFMIDDAGWSDDYTKFTISKVNLDRGDVSAVNYGANPYTSISARSREFIRDIDHLPPGLARAAIMRLANRADLYEAHGVSSSNDEPAGEPRPGRLVSAVDAWIATVEATR